MSKTVNGDNEGTFTSLLVNPDDSIVNDLTVQGTLTASGVAVSTLTGQYYTASDANYQYRFDSGTMDLKSTSSGAPTVRLLNNVNSSASTILQTGTMTALTSNSTTQYSSQENTSAGTAGGAGLKAINNSSNSVELTMRSGNHSTKPNHADILAIGATSMHFGTNNSADISIRTNAAERINVANTLVTVKQPLSETDTTESTTTGTGSIVTAGGLGVAKNITAGGTVTGTTCVSKTANSGATGITATDIWNTTTRLWSWHVGGTGNTGVGAGGFGLWDATASAYRLKVNTAGQSTFTQKIFSEGTLQVGAPSTKGGTINLGQTGAGTDRSGFLYQSSTGELILSNLENTWSRFDTNGIGRIYILGNGNVGVGNDFWNPSYLMHVNGTLTCNDAFRVNGDVKSYFGATISSGPTGDARVNIQDQTSNCISFYYSTTKVGSITNTGSSTAYNTSSDYRVKENVVSLSNAISRIKQLPVHRFNFISDPTTTVDGFLAHEAALVVPEAICGTKDAVDENGNMILQQIDQSKLVPLLTAALQESIQRIETLETFLRSKYPGEL